MSDISKLLANKLQVNRDKEQEDEGQETAAKEQEEEAMEEEPTEPNDDEVEEDSASPQRHASPTASEKLLGLTPSKKSESAHRPAYAKLIQEANHDLQRQTPPSHELPRNVRIPEKLPTEAPVDKTTTTRSESEFDCGLVGANGLPFSARASPLEILFKSQTMPNVEPYTALGDRSFFEFLNDFNSKYPFPTFNDFERRTIFVKLLDRKALTSYKALDETIQRGSLNGIIEGLMVSWRKDNRVNSLVAIQKLNKLKLEKRLDVYCDKLQQYTSEAHPSLGNAELSFLRASHLYNQIINWPRSADALNIMEKSAREDVYAKLKELVFQWDRVRRSQQEIQQANEIPSTGNPPQKSFRSGNYQQQDKKKEGWQRNPNQIVCLECHKAGHYKAQCPNRGVNHQMSGNNVQNTNTSVHQSNRPQSPWNHTKQEFIPQNPNQNRGQKPAAGRNVIQEGEEDDPGNLLQRWSSLSVPAQIKTLSSHDLCYFGNRSVHEVTIANYRCRALVDSGAQPSVLTTKMYEIILGTLAIPREHIIVLNSNPTATVIDASGHIVQILAQVAMKVKLTQTGKEAMVAFQIVKATDTDPPNEILIGTNCFDSLGIKLTFEKVHDTPLFDPKSNVDKIDEDNDRNNVESKEKQEIKATVVKRIELKPGEAKWTSIELDWSTEKYKNKEVALKPWKTDEERSIIAPSICRFDPKGRTQVLINNPTPKVMILRAGHPIGTISEIHEVYQVSTRRLHEILQLSTVDGHQKSRDQTEVQTAHVETNTQVEMLAKEDRIQQLVEIAQASQEKPLSEELKNILVKYEDHFALSDEELKQTHLVEHNVDTGAIQPIRQKVRPIPFGIRREFKEIIDGLLARGIIEPSASPWASPIVLVGKKDGSIRLCVDYRQLNKVIKLDAYPLPGINHILQMLAGKQFFSTLDLCSGFWQIKLTEEAKEKTAFISTLGLFQFKVLPFGLATSPATFQRLLDTVLQKFNNGQNEVFVYIYDLLIATETEERHYIILEEVMEELQRANLAVKLKKCKFIQDSVSYLGHRIDKDGVKTDPEKVKAIAEAKAPKNVKELRSFLGLCGYYRRFVLKFATIAQPLFALTTKDTQYKWTEECEQAFQKLKKSLCEAPILLQPDFQSAYDGTKPFEIYTDASGRGIGGVICQKGKDQLLHPISFTSRALTKAESHYHVTDLEALAIIHALQKFQPLIYNMTGTIVKTDHRPLLCLFKKNISPKMLRWSLIIQNFNISIQYVKGQGNTVADALSRGLAPQSPEGTEDQACDDLTNQIVCKVTIDEENPWLTELRNDSVFGEIITMLQEENRQNKTPLLSNMLYDGHKRLQLTDFFIDEGFLWLLLDGETPRKVVPLSQRRTIFDLAHEGKFAGHFSPKKIYRQLKLAYFWDNMAKDIGNWHKECVKCFITNIQDKMVPPLNPIITTKPYELIGIDLMDLGPTTRGNRYVVVIIDHFSKFAGAYPVPNKSAETVAEVIVERWLGECRWPKGFISDQGSEFINEIMESLRKITKITWRVTKGYNPRENGITERFNQTLQRSIKKIIDNPSEWDRILPFILYAYNITSHEATGESPFYLLHGYDPPFPFDDENPRPNYQIVDYSDYKEALREGMQEGHRLAQARNQKEAERHTNYHNNKHKTDKKKYPQIGDRVFMKIPNNKTSKHPKLSFQIQGPYRVLETSNNSALITLIYKEEEPVRVQFDLLILLPPGLQTQNWTPKLKRKIRPRELKCIGLWTGTHQKTLNNQFISRHTSEVDIHDGSHPSFYCNGVITEEGVYRCPISSTELGMIARYYKYEIDNKLKKIPTNTTEEMARCLAWLEDSSIMENTRIAGIINGKCRPIPTEAWARAFKYSSKTCHHIHEAIQARMREEKARFEPEIIGTDTADILHGIQRSSNIEPHSFAGKDLIIVQRMPLLSNISSIGFQFAKMVQYNKQIKEVCGEILAHGYRTAMVMMPENQEPHDILADIKKLQSIGHVNHTLVILLPPLITKDVASWREYSNNINLACVKLEMDLEKKEEICHVYFHGIQLDAQPVLGSAATYLGEHLKERYPAKPIDFYNLHGYFSKVNQELKQVGLFHGFRIHPNETRRTEEHPIIPIKRRRNSPTMFNSSHRTNEFDRRRSREEHQPADVVRAVPFRRPYQPSPVDSRLHSRRGNSRGGSYPNRRQH